MTQIEEDRTPQEMDGGPGVPAGPPPEAPRVRKRDSPQDRVRTSPPRDEGNASPAGPPYLIGKSIPARGPGRGGRPWIDIDVSRVQALLQETGLSLGQIRKHLVIRKGERLEAVSLATLLRRMREYGVRPGEDGDGKVSPRSEMRA